MTVVKPPPPSSQSIDYVVPYKKIRLSSGLTEQEVELINSLPGQLRAPVQEMVAFERERLSTSIRNYRGDLSREPARNKIKRTAYQKQINELAEEHRNYYSLCVPYIAKKYNQVTKALCQNHGQRLEVALIKTTDSSMSEWRRRTPAGCLLTDHLVGELLHKGWSAIIEWRQAPQGTTESYIYLICDFTEM